MSDPRKLAVYEQGIGRGKALHAAAATRQIELIKQQDEIIGQNEQMIALLREVVRLLGQPRT